MIEGVEERNAMFFVLRTDFLERRRLIHVVADPQAEHDQDNRNAERDPPSIGEEVLFGESCAWDRGANVAEREAKQRTGLRHCTVKATLITWGVFDGEEH